MTPRQVHETLRGLGKRRGEFLPASPQEEKAIALTQQMFEELGGGVLTPLQKKTLKRIGVDLSQDANGDRYRELMGAPLGEA